MCGWTNSGGCSSFALVLRVLPRRVFELVAAARSEETFIALCLLSVTGASLLTQRMGFSDTLGAFAAGVLLSGAPPGVVPGPARSRRSAA